MPNPGDFKFDDADKALIADLIPILEKHGILCGNTARETAEFVVICLDAQALLRFYNMTRAVGETPVPISSSGEGGQPMAEKREYRFIGGHMDGKRHPVEDGLQSMIMPTAEGSKLDFPIYYRSVEKNGEIVFRLSGS